MVREHGLRTVKLPPRDRPLRAKACKNGVNPSHRTPNSGAMHRWATPRQSADLFRPADCVRLSSGLVFDQSNNCRENRAGDTEAGKLPHQGGDVDGIC